MAIRAFNIAAIVSAVLFAAVFVLSLIGVDNNPARRRISLGPLFHISVVKYRGFPRLVIFNDPEGPYRGSIIGLAGAPPAYDRMEGFGETAGIYYRYFHWKTGGSLWTLAVSLLYPVIFFAILPGVWGFRFWRWRNRSTKSVAKS